MNRQRILRGAAATLSWAVALSGGDAFGRDGRQTAVTIGGVHYTLPSYVDNARIEPRNPLCYDYEYFYLLIIDRELFINGERRYRARPGDRVVVSYPEGVRVNGHQPPPQPRKTLEGARPCASRQ